MSHRAPVEVPAATARSLDAEARRALIDTAETCPVRLSLAGATAVETEYLFGD